MPDTQLRVHIVGPLLPIGLFGVAWTSYGPPITPWVAPMIFIALFGVANVCCECLLPLDIVLMYLPEVRYLHVLY